MRSTNIVQAAWKKFWLPLVIQVALGLLLNTKVAPGGILDFEFARTRIRAQEIMDSWSQHTYRFLPALNLLTDFWFIVAYFDVLLTVSTLWVTRRSWIWNDPSSRDGKGAQAINGRIPGLCAFVVAAADFVETAALLLQVCSGASDLLAAIAYWGATIKFGFLTVPITVAFLALLLGRPIQNKRNSSQHS